MFPLLLAFCDELFPTLDMIRMLLNAIDWTNFHALGRVMVANAFRAFLRIDDKTVFAL